MALAIRNTVGDNTPSCIDVKPMANSAITEGDIVTIDTTTKKLRRAGATDMFWGIAMTSYPATAAPLDHDRVNVHTTNTWVVRIPYVGTTKTSLTDADMYDTLFPLNAAQQLNLDGAGPDNIFTVVGYDNARKTADVVMQRDVVGYLG